MERRRSGLKSLALVAACFVFASAARGSSLPIEMKFRHSIMESDCGFIGRVIETKPFSVGEWERESLVVVHEAIFGAVSAGDTLRVGWRANRRELPDGLVEIVAAGDEGQLSGFTGKPMFWLISGRDLARYSIWPVDLSAESDARLIDLAAYADGQPKNEVPTPIRYKNDEELEGDPANHEKCSKISQYLREVVAKR